MSEETSNEPTFAESIAEANASERSARSDASESHDDGARQQSDGANFKDLIEDYNAEQSRPGLKAKPRTESRDEFPLPAPTEREAFLEALRGESPDYGRSNAAEFAAAEKAAAGESFLDKMTATERGSFLKHYGLSEESLQNPDVRRVLERQLEQQWGEEEAGEEQEDNNEEDDETENDEEEKTDPEKPTEAAKPVAMPASLEELLKPENGEALQQFNEATKATWESAQKNSEPVMVDFLTKNLAQAMETPEEHIPKLRSAVETLNFGAQSFVQSAVPPMIEQGMLGVMQAVTQNFGEMLEQVCPGLRDSFIEATAGNTWAEVCASDEFKDLNLPEYGSNEFYQLAQKIHADNPWLNEFDVRGQDGQPLPVREALKIKAQVSARLAAGERISPKMVMKQIAEAQQTAKKGAESRQRRVMASKSLGAGSSRGEMGESKDTSFADAINAYMQNQRSGGRR